MKKVNNIISSKNIITLVTASGKINSACDYKLSTEDAAFINIGSSLAIDEIKKKDKFKYYFDNKKQKFKLL